MSRDFFQYIRQMNLSVRNISAQIISGPSCGTRALWQADTLVYSEGSEKVWLEVSKQLSDIRGPKIIDIGCNSVFCETLSDTPKLIICGCGHVSIPVITMAKMLGFQVTAIDDRPVFCDHARTALADEVICDNFSNALTEVSDSQNNYYVIVTRGHRYDLECLKQIIPRAHTYVGMIGSRARVAKIKTELLSEGYLQSDIDAVHMPIGLKIKAETPEEIAVSIIAEIIQIKNETYASYHYSKEMLKALAEKSPEYRQALATIVSRRGSAPRSAGTKMLILETGQTIGTVGGGCAEAAILQKALYCIRHQTPTLVHVDMSGQNAEEDGMVCGGVIDVFIDLL